MDAEISKANSISTRVWAKVPLALFCLAASILIVTLLH